MGASAPALSFKRGERLFVELADSPEAVREAQALRYQVFGEELGAKLKAGENGLDIDEFDAFCEHLLVRETKTNRVVGCTRLLSNQGAERIGTFYSESEFELGIIPSLPGRLLELGRTCVSHECRHGSVIAVLWSGVAQYIQQHQVDYLFGCASVPLGENDCQAAAIMNRLRRQAMAPTTMQVIPRVPLLTGVGATDVLDAPLPALLKGYVRLGAVACGEPCRDPDFEVADVLMLLDMRSLNPSYARHFLERI
ncbi:GNAT family N-acyltransferase [Lamprobacter modestohalophilus]|uniref:GNAT family N-acetyltransferase n=1 Tax=Lamprobacter modestohalophilus TaxID=1064514 RepID=UPI002ADEC0AB|nr:GNAT family N-acyltransferase [Lamprobacter modestohalophilus]MEA1048558.1 GNAT family N-acyltransferase [Lamprobacter modestohalophilus]